jgi:hypothetical protein
MEDLWSEQGKTFPLNHWQMSEGCRTSMKGNFDFPALDAVPSFQSSFVWGLRMSLTCHLVMWTIAFIHLECPQKTSVPWGLVLNSLLLMLTSSHYTWPTFYVWQLSLTSGRFLRARCRCTQV